MKTMCSRSADIQIHLEDESSAFGSSISGYVVHNKGGLPSDQLQNFLRGCGQCEERVAMELAVEHSKIAIIRNLWVPKELRGKGRGTYLLSHFIDQAFEEGATAILLECDKCEANDFDLRKWYERWDFLSIKGYARMGNPIMILQ